MNDSTFFVQIPDTLRDLKNHVSGQFFGKVRQFDDLVE